MLNYMFSESDFISVFGTGLVFWAIGFSSAFLMLKFRQGLEIST